LKRKRKKNPKAARDSNEYEKNRTRKFSTKWQVGWLWPRHVYDKGKICEWCIENKQTLVVQNVLNSTRFIDGCTSYKAESISFHEKSAVHLLAQQCHRANLHPENPEQI